jgi:hypothetical protein
LQEQVEESAEHIVQLNAELRELYEARRDGR